MSFEPPAGILDIGNATLRVGKLEVTETTGLNQGLQNIVKNDLLITEFNFCFIIDWQIFNSSASSTKVSMLIDGAIKSCCIIRIE